MKQRNDRALGVKEAVATLAVVGEDADDPAPAMSRPIGGHVVVVEDPNRGRVEFREVLQIVLIRTA